MVIIAQPGCIATSTLFEAIPLELRARRPLEPGTEGRAAEVLNVERPEGKEKVEVDSAFRVDTEVAFDSVRH